MKKEFEEYLKSIGIATETLLKRVETIYQFYSNICPEEIKDIFVTDYIKNDGTREYESLWFFSDNYCMEAKEFATADNFDIMLVKNIIRWEVKKQEYDFKKAIDKSRIFLHVNISIALSADFKASKENCDFLREIFLKYVKPKIKN